VSDIEIPKDWTFKSLNVAENFDSHVKEQLPWYDLVTDAVAHIARHYIPVGGLVYDIGASSGNIGRSISDTLISRNASFIAIESSQEMASQYNSYGTLSVCDAVDYQYEKYDLCVCFLTLMFIEPSRRSRLIKKLRENIKEGGALIVVDKCEPIGGYLSVIMSRLSLSQKLKNGVSPTEIIAKELSLSGVQRPISAIHLVGATEFFRFGDFAGWIFEGDYERP